MIRKINNNLQSIILSWIVIFVVVSVHPACQKLFSEICSQKTSVSLNSQLSGCPPIKQQFHSFAAGRNGTCCKEQQCDEKEELFFSGQFPEAAKYAWSSKNKISFSDDKNENLQIISNQKPAQNNISIDIFTQFFLC
ncbi:MAG: hypothetical protein KKC20_24265 [Proteobacteria bacterium]|nr:hypothetical protein [Desulfobacula sp.]MBU0973776.1 hypothetical protein [Pseudomonadota bacterium]